MAGNSQAQGDFRETGRIEAFSDGVFAVAITLLVLSFQPPPNPLSDAELARWLVSQWPVFFAFVTSFITVGVMWINHHRMFTLIKRADTALMGLNLLLLMLIVFVPFPTELMGDYIAIPGHRLAAMLYSGTYVALAIGFNALWRYAAHNNRLLDKRTDPRRVATISFRYLFGPPAYLISFGIAWFSAPASLALNLLMAVFFALPG